jgi:preprotein translocase subunit SecD
MRRRIIGLIVVLGVAWGGLAALALNGFEPKLGLDLQGGTSVLLTAPAGTEEDVLAQAVEQMRQRIEAIGGVQEPEIQISGANTVLVQLPGVTDETRALDAIGRTGLLSFRPVLDTTPGLIGPLGSDYVDPATTTTTTEGTGSTTTSEATTSTTEAVTTTTEPATTTTTAPPPPELLATLDPETGLTIVDDPVVESYLPYVNSVFGQAFPVVLHLGPAAVLGETIDQATPGYDSTQAQWLVQLAFNDEGGDAFAALTAEAAGFPSGDPRRQIAIVLDGEVVSAPAVNEDVDPGVGITGGQAVITVGSSQEEAQDLGVVLRYGALPVAFERSQVNKVSATLGADSLRIGLISGLVGLLLVALVLVFYYRALGVVAVIGLTVFGALVVSIFSLLGETRGLTLTLAGVTGIIVSVGITADSYIVYFERIKDEIRNGKKVRSAVTDGFTSAFRTILTADFVSLMAAVLLYFLAVGPVKGFALALGIATLLDIVIARVFTRRAAWVVAHSRLGGGVGPMSIGAAAGLAKEERS